MLVLLSALPCCRFGYLYDSFGTVQASLLTQFSILVGDSTPAYTSGNNPWLSVYVVFFVLSCSLAMLNFLLAIVVNG